MAFVILPRTSTLVTWSLYDDITSTETVNPLQPGSRAHLKDLEGRDGRKCVLTCVDYDTLIISYVAKRISKYVSYIL